jgi:hypothetical protein
MKDCLYNLPLHKDSASEAASLVRGGVRLSMKEG